MRPTPIPDNEIWDGAVRTAISPPDGDLTNPDIAPVEALVEIAPSGVRQPRRGPQPRGAAGFQGYLERLQDPRASLVVAWCIAEAPEGVRLR